MYSVEPVMSHTSEEGSVQHHITFRKIEKYMYNLQNCNKHLLRRLLLCSIKLQYKVKTDMFSVIET